MTLEEAKAWLGEAYVFHRPHRWQNYPHHSSYALVDVQKTCDRVRRRIQETPPTADTSFSSTVDEHKRRLRLAYGKRA